MLMYYTPTMHQSSFQNMSHVDEPVSAEDKELMSKLPHAFVIGHLQYLNTCTRPDLAYVLSKLSRYLKNPGLMHWQAAVRVLQYLEATELVGLRCTGGLESEGMCDSSWGENIDDRRSQAAVVFTRGGTAVSWKSWRIGEVSLSTTEAEYLLLRMLQQRRAGCLTC